MRSTTLVSVTSDRKLELPLAIQSTLQPGDEYLIWQTEDMILFKRIQKPTTLADIRAKVSSLGADPEELTLEELSQIVREVRTQG